MSKYTPEEKQSNQSNTQDYQPLNNFPNIDVRQYNPTELFNSEVHNGLNWPFGLSEAFRNARYAPYPFNQNNASLSQTDPNFKSNTGAVQLFNINGTPLLNAQNVPAKPFSSVSVSYGPKSTIGHSERIGMRDALNAFMPESTREIERPSYYGNAREKSEERNKQILKHLVENAHNYKTYLQNKEAVVKMWSERQPCAWGDSSCSDFIKNIFPSLSQYGYIASNKDNLAALSKELDNAYLAYMRQTQPLNPISSSSSLSSPNNPIVSAISTASPPSTFAAQQLSAHPFTVNPSSNSSSSSSSSSSPYISIASHNPLASSILPSRVPYSANSRVPQNLLPNLDEQFEKFKYNPPNS